MSGYYDCGNSYPAWDFNLSLACVITFSGTKFNRTGIFTMGSSVTGNATFNDCKEIIMSVNGTDLDGSIFKNPNSIYLLEVNI